MAAVMATACPAFGLTVSRAKTEAMGLQIKYGGKVSFGVIAHGHANNDRVCVL